MNAAKRLREVEETITRYLRRNVARETEAGIHEAVETFNAWVAESSDGFKSRTNALEQELRRIEDLDRKITRRDASTGR